MGPFEVSGKTCSIGTTGPRCQWLWFGIPREYSHPFTRYLWGIIRRISMVYLRLLGRCGRAVPSPLKSGSIAEHFLRFKSRRNLLPR